MTTQLEIIVLPMEIMMTRDPLSHLSTSLYSIHNSISVNEQEQTRIIEALRRENRRQEEKIFILTKQLEEITNPCERISKIIIIVLITLFVIYIIIPTF